jgi:hypothetical protein
MGREFGSGRPVRGAYYGFSGNDLDHPSSDEPVRDDNDDGGASAQATLLGLTHDLRNETVGLDQAHAAAVELNDLVESYREEGKPAPAVPLLAVARVFVALLDDDDIPTGLLSRLEPSMAALASELGARLVAPDANASQPPMWLDVVPPAHGHVNVAGVLTAFSKGHVTLADSATVVTANDCKLEAKDHYHVRRVSLDCRSLYKDAKAMAAFVRAMHDPSPDNTTRLLNELKRIIDPHRPVEPQHYRHRLPAPVSTDTARAGVVAMGAGSTVHTTTKYHLRETVIPLAELLLLQPGLIAALATRPDGDTMAEPLLKALGMVEDLNLLRNARNFPSVSTSVSHSLGGTRVRLASAVMVGYGNTLTATSAVERGRQRLTNLSRFNRAVAASSNRPPEKSKPPAPRNHPKPQRGSCLDPVLRLSQPQQQRHQPLDPSTDTGLRRTRPSGPGPVSL